MKSALIQVSVENFLSFKDRVTFSMEASGSLIENTYFQGGLDSHRLKVFKTGFIFGSNASGKTNVLKVLQFIDTKIENSHSDSQKEGLSTRPFLFDKKTQEEPSFFEIIFQSNENLYKYNFSIIGNQILTENLYQILTTKEKQLFKRDKQKFSFFNEFENNINLIDVSLQKTKTYSLFISAAKEWIENEIIFEVTKFFKESLSSICVLKETYGGYTMERIFNKDSNFTLKVLDFLKKADFCIDNVSVDMKIDDLDNDGIKLRKRFKVEFEHPVFEEGKKVSNVKLNLLQESLGTEAFFKVLGPIIGTLENGNILLVDELNASLHPHLCKFLIDLFNNPDTNPKKAQLIATLHDTTLLNYSDDLNKGQVWFTERDKFGATSLYSLDEFDIRNGDKNYQLKYLNGRFGAVPFIRN